MMDRWFVFFGRVTFLFFFSGTLKSNGVILAEMVQKLQTSHLLVSWAFSLQNGIAYIISPITAFLLNTFSKKTVGVAGGFLCGLGYVLCGSLVNNEGEMLAVFVLSGVGFGLLGITSFLAFQEHFENNFSTMTSCASLFEYAGVALLPPVLKYFKSTFGLDVSLSLFGALCWQLIPASVALRTRSRQGKHRNKDKSRSLELTNHCERHSPPDDIGKDETRDTSRKFLFLCSSLVEHRKFRYFMALEFIGYVIFTSWALFLVSVGIASGLNEDQAVFLSTIGGVGGVFGKLLAIFLCHFEKMNSQTCCFIPFLLNGVCMMSSTLIPNFYVLCGLTVLSGTSMGVHSTGVFSLLPAMICRTHLKQAVAVDFTLNGVAVQLGGLVSGFLNGTFGSAIPVFQFNAILCFLSLPLAVMWALIDGQPIKDCGQT